VLRSADPARGYRRLDVVARAFLLLLMLSILPDAARAQPAAGDRPEVCRIGINIEDLYEFDLARDTFGAVLWVWSLCPSDRISPLQDMALPTADSLSAGEVGTLETGGAGHYQYRRIQGTFRHDWDMRRYPFDRHRIVIPLDETRHGASVVTFEADTEQSFLAPSARAGLDEWAISELALQTSISEEPSTYGLPNADASRYARATVSVEIQRTQLLTFLKLTSGVFAAALIAFLTFFYDPRDRAGFSGRLGLLVGTLFAVLINLRTSDTTIGDASRLTLVTEIHLVTLVLIVALALLALRERRRAENDLWVTYPNWPLFSAMVAIYLLVNAGFVARAALG
jgi:hypothetical protein